MNPNLDFSQVKFDGGGGGGGFGAGFGGGR
jgi:hypothetical protein